MSPPIFPRQYSPDFQNERPRCGSQRSLVFIGTGRIELLELLERHLAIVVGVELSPHRRDVLGTVLGLQVRHRFLELFERYLTWHIAGVSRQSEEASREVPSWLVSMMDMRV